MLARVEAALEMKRIFKLFEEVDAKVVMKCCTEGILFEILDHRLRIRTIISLGSDFFEKYHLTDTASWTCDLATLINLFENVEDARPFEICIFPESDTLSLHTTGSDGVVQIQLMELLRLVDIDLQNMLIVEGAYAHSSMAHWHPLRFVQNMSQSIRDGEPMTVLISGSPYKRTICSKYYSIDWSLPSTKCVVPSNLDFLEEKLIVVHLDLHQSKYVIAALEASTEINLRIPNMVLASYLGPSIGIAFGPSSTVKFFFARDSIVNPLMVLHNTSPRNYRLNGRKFDKLGELLEGNLEFSFFSSFFTVEGLNGELGLTLREQADMTAYNPPTSSKQAPHLCVEITNDVVEFLKGIFSMHDNADTGTVGPSDVQDMLSTSPDCPWAGGPYKDDAQKLALGSLTRDGFLSEWSLITLLELAKSVDCLNTYSRDASSAICSTSGRRMDYEKQQSERNGYQCFVFGPERAGKSALLDGFLRRPFSDKYHVKSEERYAVNVVDGPSGSKKFLVLREIPEDKVKNLLSAKESLAGCDIAIFVYDSSDVSSWKRTAKLLVEVAGHGENTGYEVPSLIVAAKGDLDPFPRALRDSTRVSQDMGIEAPIPISAKLGDFNDIFRRLVSSAENPHLSIPKIETRKGRMQYHRLFDRLVSSVGAVVAVVGFAAYCVYAARKKSSS